MHSHYLQVFPPIPINVARYITVLSTRLTAYATLQNHVSALRKFYTLSGFLLDTTHPVIDILLKSLKRQMSAASKPKAPLTPEQIVLISHIIDSSDPKQFTFYVALLIHFFSIVRKSNLLPPSKSSYSKFKHLSRGNVMITESCLVLTLPWTKTLQAGEDIFTLPIAAVPDSVIDPVASYKQLVERFPVPNDFPAFSYSDGNNIHILTQNDYVQLLKNSLQKLNIPSQAYSSHSVRRGGASLMHQAQVPVSLIKHQGTWKSDCYQKYLCFNHDQKLIPTLKMQHFINNMFK